MIAIALRWAALGVALVEPRVTWRAPPSCPTESEVLARVAAVLDEGGSGRRAEVRLTFMVEVSGEGFRLSATEEAPSGPSAGERTLEAATCEELADAAALIAAIAIDPGLRFAEDVPTDPHAPDTPVTSENGSEPAEDLDADRSMIAEAPPASPTPSPTTVAADPRAADDVHPGSGVTPGVEPSEDPSPRTAVALLFASELGIGWGRLAAPLPMAQGRVGVGAEWRWLRGWVRLTGVGPSFGQAGDGPAGGIMGLGAVGVSICGQSPGRIRVVGCLGTDVGLVGGRGRNTVDTLAARSVWWGVEAELGLEIGLNAHWSVGVRAEGGGVPATPDLVVAGQGRVCCERWLAGVRLGALGRWGR